MGQIIYDGLDQANRSSTVENDPRRAAAGHDVIDDGGELEGRLWVDGDYVGPGLDELLDPPLRIYGSELRDERSGDERSGDERSESHEDCVTIMSF